ncbi:MAG: class I SAM-dependent methyltransferase [Syntrophaceae bacterium]|nr:class I SAM-dependent methyltransferase [Syntrophaceae bacterium]
MVKNKYLELNQRNSEINKFKVHYDYSCVICNAKTPSQFIGGVSEHEYSQTTSLIFPVYRCCTCQLTYLYPRPDVSELKTIYPPDYYSYNLSMNKPETESNKRSFVKTIWFWMNLRTYRTKLSPFIKQPAERTLKILDIGCGTGAQLDNMKKLFPYSETHGVDINKLALEKAEKGGHKLYYGRFEDVNLPCGYFDVVHSTHVIEHVERPDIFVQKCLDLLSPNGILLIETPNTNSLDYKIFKKGHWGGYHAPRHWYLFNIETFRNLAKRFNAQIIYYAPYNTAVFWNWSCHSICKALFGKKIADRLFPPITIFYGGLHSFIILSFFSILERIILGLFNKANSMRIILKKI